MAKFIEKTVRRFSDQPKRFFSKSHRLRNEEIGILGVRRALGECAVYYLLSEKGFNYPADFYPRNLIAGYKGEFFVGDLDFGNESTSSVSHRRAFPFVYRAPIVMKSVLDSEYFKKLFSEQYGDLEFEERFYAPQMILTSDEGTEEVGFHDHPMKVDFCINHFIKDTKNLDAMIEEERLPRLFHGDILEIDNYNYKLKFKRGFFERILERLY